MSKKTYWIINENRNVEGLNINEYYNCPNCMATSMFVLYDGIPLPEIKYCPYCGKRLYIKEKE